MGVFQGDEFLVLAQYNAYTVPRAGHYFTKIVLPSPDTVLMDTKPQFFLKVSLVINDFPDCKVHGANMGHTWVMWAPCGPHVDPTNLAIRVWLWCVGHHFSPCAMKPHMTVEQSVQWAKLLSSIRDITHIVRKINGKKFHWWFTERNRWN